MRLAIIVALAAALLGCEPEQITACAYACAKSNRGMLKYSKADGCICSAEPEAAK